MDADLDTLATALYVKTDDLLKAYPERLSARPRIGIAPKIGDAELVTLAVMQSLLGHASEPRWLLYARTSLHASTEDVSVRAFSSDGRVLAQKKVKLGWRGVGGTERCGGPEEADPITLRVNS